MDKIDRFFDEHRFLSNFYPAIVKVAGFTFPSVEHAYQAFKSNRKDIITKFCDPNMTAGQAKRLGKQLNIRKDWDDIKVELMYTLIRDKFTRHEDLKKKLLDTGIAELIEGNTWGDKTWGMCNGEGLNLLGQILMLVRSEIRGLEKQKEDRIEIRREIEKAREKKNADEFKDLPKTKEEKKYGTKEFIALLMEGNNE
jgi:hypothetical protein